MVDVSHAYGINDATCGILWISTGDRTLVWKAIIHLGIALTLSAVFTWCSLAFLTSSSRRVVHSWTQPKEMVYQQNTIYTLFVREIAPDWSTAVIFPSQTRRHEIFIGRDESYGHWFDFTCHAGSLDDDEIDAYIRRSTVDWTDKGVALTQESGHVVFFPSKTFIGGR